MADTPTRRWFQFRLRTLLIGVVLISVPFACVAHEYRIVAARKSWMAEHPPFDYDGWSNLNSHPTASRSLSPIRRLLGDVPQVLIFARNPAEQAAAEELFPEAEICHAY